MLNNTSCTSELMEPWGYNSAATVLFFIQIFGFSLNLFVIILMCRDAQVYVFLYPLIEIIKQMENIQIWNPINIIIFNLVCCDFSVSIFGNPFALASALSHRWRFGVLGCQLYGFFMALLGNFNHTKTYIKFASIVAYTVFIQFSELRDMRNLFEFHVLSYDDYFKH